MDLRLKTAPSPVRAAARALAARGSSLAERLTDAYEPVESGTGAAAARERLESWRAAVDRGAPGRLTRRLAWDGLDESAVLARLGEARLAEGEPVPGWASFFEDALGREAPEGLFDPENLVPFEEAVAPFVGAAWERLAAAPGSGRLSAAAGRQLRRGLLATLGATASGALGRELAMRRSLEVSGFDALFLDPGAPPARRLYRALLAEAGRLEFWLERAALARALATGALNWSAALAELLARLEADGAGLSRIFSVRPGEAVAALDFSASDPHDGGRRVGLLTFASGARAVYKPRGAELLTAWEDFLAELEKLGAPEPFARRRLFAPGPHAWLEFVERSPCRDGAEVETHYRRMGHLLALMHALQARDLHFENIVAAGAFPVPIDLEVILQGDVRRPGASGPTATDDAASLVDRSVLATGLLPIWPEDQEDFGALGAGMERVGRVLRWSAVNTDAMALKPAEAARDAENSLVVLDGKAVNSFLHRATLAAGFRDGARFLAGPGRAAQGGAAYARLLAAPVRALLRSTGVYAKLIGTSLNGEVRGDGVDRSLALEAATSAWAADESARALWPLALAELRAMEIVDVPIFHARAGGAEAWSPDGARGPLLTRTGRDASLAAWDGLDETGIALQEKILAAAMLGRAASDPRTARTSAANPEAFSAATAHGLVAEIAKDMGARAARSAAGAAWIEPAYDSSMTCLKLTVLGEKLYDGASGLALFLAARATRPDGEAARALAREAAAPLLALDERALRTAARLRGIGGATGVGGGAYALARAAVFLRDEAYLDAARGLARTIDAAAVAADREFDVMFGSAGAALSLLALHETDPKAEWLERAVLCGERLLEARASWGGLPRAWTSKDKGSPASGFSHGAAGIACALWRLGARTGDARFREAASEAWAFDDALFVPETGYWRRDAADDGTAGAGWATWCWGAPGSGLSRLEAAAAGDAAALAGVERSLGAVRSAPARGMDHLCCGEFGVAEFLLETGKVLKRPELIAAARARAAARLPAGPGLGFRLHPALEPGPTSPTFYGGTAGIGYALLRLAEPDAFPCAVAWR